MRRYMERDIENLCDHHEILDRNLRCLEAKSIVNHYERVSNATLLVE